MNKLERVSPEALRGNPRATHASWEKYQQMITAAYRAHPNGYVYRPMNMVPGTVCSRARDAVRGAIAFAYPSEIPTVDLAKWYSEVIFKHDTEHVYIGPAKAVADILHGEVTNPNKTTLTFPTLSFEEVAAFALLISTGRIVGPVQIASPPDLSLLPERLNVELLERKDGSLVIL